MKTVANGQCGLCKHFGSEEDQNTNVLQQIRITKQAPPDLTEECGHPTNENISLVVTPISGCQGFEPATM